MYQNLLRETGEEVDDGTGGGERIERGRGRGFTDGICSRGHYS